MLTYRLKPILSPGDLVATFEGPHSRPSALDWLGRAPLRVRQNIGILTISTLDLGNGRNVTTIRVGGTL